MSQRTFVQNLRKTYLIFLPRPRYLKVENNSFELTRIFKESFNDQG